MLSSLKKNFVIERFSNVFERFFWTFQNFSELFRTF